MMRSRRIRALWVAAIFAVGCDLRKPETTSDESTEDRASSALSESPLEGLPGIYKIVSSEQATKACSEEGGMTQVERTDGFFYIARHNPTELEKRLGIVGMITACDDLETCRKNAKSYVEIGAAPLGSFGGPIALKDDGTLEQSSNVTERRKDIPRVEDRCDVWWNRATVSLEDGEAVFREEHHFASYPKADNDLNCGLTGYAKARNEPCGRLRITKGRKIEDVPSPAAD